ncbi:hypothetical protein D3C87_1830900 [compost metagenome]
MEFAVGFDIARSISALNVLGRRLMRIGQHFLAGSSDALGRQPRHHALHLGQGFEHRHQFGGGRPVHEHAGARHDGHQPLRGQHQQRLAHRRARAVERIGQRLLVDLCPRGQRAGLNGRHHVFSDAILE